MNRQEAQKAGLKRYEGRPCKYGHGTTRATTSGGCVVCRQTRANAWQAENKERRKEVTRANNKAWQKRNPEKLMLGRAKFRATRDNLPFDITLDDIVIPSHCPVFNTPMETPSLDRVKTELGYVKGNVRVISMRANRMKQESSIEDFKALIAYMEKEGS